MGTFDVKGLGLGACRLWIRRGSKDVFKAWGGLGFVCGGGELLGVEGFGCAVEGSYRT